MNRGTGFLIGGLLAGIVAVTYILVTGFDAPAAVDSSVDVVRDLVISDDAADAPPADATPAPEPPAAPAPSRPAPAPARAETGAPPQPELAAPTPADPPAAAPPESDAPEAAPASAPSGRPALNRASHFLPGNYPNWTEFGVEVSEPVVVRAGGVVSVADVVSGPDGVRLAPAPGAAPPPGATQLVMPSAPYLALLGRICSASRCSDPFLIGDDTTVCPADLQVAGELQVLTNNYVRVNGRQTSSRYSTATGGFAFYTEPAPESACATGGATGAPVRQDAAVLAAGEVLRRPEYALSSGITFWKPFFLPLGAPIVVRASGLIQATNGRPATGPEGVVVPEAERWWTPRDTVTTLAPRRGRLYVESLPYNALIGRLCGGGSCGEPFLVGAERVICAAAPHTDRLELWLNRVILTPSMLDNQTPLTFEMFDVQTQRGGYEFEVAPAPDGACGATVTPPGWIP